jgi:hypothetical protein
MNCTELAALIPELVDGTISPELQEEAQLALANCPDSQHELDIARQVRAFLLEMQAANSRFTPSPAFETFLMTQIRRQSSTLDLVDLSSKTFGLWLVDLLNLVGGLIDPRAARTFPGSPS